MFKTYCRYSYVIFFFPFFIFRDNNSVVFTFSFHTLRIICITNISVNKLASLIFEDNIIGNVITFNFIYRNFQMVLKPIRLRSSLNWTNEEILFNWSTH